jgi:hypothetical protein
VRRGLLLGGLDRDLACAIALGFVDDPHVIADLEWIAILDADKRLRASQSGWLSTLDPLDVATREYLRAQRALARATGERDEAARKAYAAKGRVWRLLEVRGVLRMAREAGFLVVGDEVAVA